MTQSLSSSSVPLYLQIAGTLRDRIVRGAWHTGDAIPTFDKFASEFNVARVTTRQAVQLLIAEGALLSHRGHGMFVTASRRANLAQMNRSMAPEPLGINNRSRMPPVRATEGKLASCYTHMKRSHSTDGVPFCVISLYLDERIYASSLRRFRENAVIPLLLEPPFPIARAHQTLTFDSTDAESKGLLCVSVNSPVAHVHRVFFDQDDVVIHCADVVYRDDVVRLDMKLYPDDLSPSQREFFSDIPNRSNGLFH
ncbi:GntR family transcriptional regulator [Paraburkholderia elongata]|uniref:UTRA domain-containing protein n=1 Tax=Paraburkholderia elongata TaxID=2675747 RepID=A0A972NRC4_9BURK|nr:GntR family transcriptional regulator [Paraburkholderia elongata]NPT58236.1 UTRA domain-containing protein [Paraburkholderia elongata]